MNWAITFVQTLIADIVNGLMQFAFLLLKYVLVTPYHMQYLPGFWTLVMWMEGIASAWVAVAMAKEFIVNIQESASDMGVNPLSILKNGIWSMILVWASPLLVLQIILPMTNYLMQMVKGSIGTLSNLSQGMESNLGLKAGEGIAALAGAAILPEAMFWAGAVVAGAYLILIIIVGFQSGRRWMELFYLTAMGPLMAVSKAGFSGQWDVWLKETISTSAAQAVQYFAIVLSFHFFLDSNINNEIAGQPINPIAYIFLAIGAAFFAVTGPQRLRSVINGGQSAGGLRRIGSLMRARA